jgi:hypothetical protein
MAIRTSYPDNWMQQVAALVVCAKIAAALLIAGVVLTFTSTHAEATPNMVFEV